MPNSETKENDNIKRNDLIFDLIKRRFDSEIERTNNLDGKASSLVGFISIVVGLVLGNGSLLSGADTFDLNILLSNYIIAIFYFVGVAFLLLSVGSALVALKIRRWSTVPNVETLINEYTDKAYEEVLKRNAGEMAKAVIESQNQNENKAKFVKLSWNFLLVGLIIVFLAVIINISLSTVIK